MIGQSLGHYRIIGKLGQGGMGTVYRALDTRLGRPVAIKVLPHEAMIDLERKKRFTQEARAASALNHPNIITIYDISAADGIDFIAMEWVDGKTLHQLIKRKGLPRKSPTRSPPPTPPALFIGTSSRPTSWSPARAC